MKKLYLILALLIPFQAYSTMPKEAFKQHTTDDLAITIEDKNISILDLGSEPEKELRRTIISHIIKKISKDNRIFATDAETLEAKNFFSNAIEKALKKTDPEFLQNFEMPDSFVREQVIKWKTDKFLFDKYGGRVIFQQSGAEPVDAYKEYLKEQEKNNFFTIHDNLLKESFWLYYNGEYHNYYPLEVGAQIMEKPIWEISKKFQ